VVDFGGHCSLYCLGVKMDKNTEIIFNLFVMEFISGYYRDNPWVSHIRSAEEYKSLLEIDLIKVGLDCFPVNEYCYNGIYIKDYNYIED